ncbi:MAG: hypothetical protein ABUS48_05685 [Pseudomonadota bacterium]
MTPEQNLHTLARRYCEDRMLYWRSDAAMQQVARGILGGVERIDFDDLPPVAELSRRLARASESPPELGLKADHPSPRETEEREAFATFVEGWDATDIPEQSPMPYRRVLEDAEVACLKARLEKAWGVVPGYWYPLAESVHPVTATIPLVVLRRTRDEYVLRGAKLYAGDLNGDILRFFRSHKLNASTNCAASMDTVSR